MRNVVGNFPVFLLTSSIDSIILHAEFSSSSTNGDKTKKLARYRFMFMGLLACIIYCAISQHSGYAVDSDNLLTSDGVVCYAENSKVFTSTPTGVAAADPLHLGKKKYTIKWTLTFDCSQGDTSQCHICYIADIATYYSPGNYGPGNPSSFTSDTQSCDTSNARLITTVWDNITSPSTKIITIQTAETASPVEGGSSDCATGQPVFYSEVISVIVSF